MKYQLTKTDSFKGLISAILIILVWTISIVFALRQNLNDLHHGHIAFLIFWQTFLYTGLFITAHDAMHGTAFFSNKITNKIIGMMSVLIYAMFSYKNLFIKHHQHHKLPGTQDDPDFHDGIHKGFLSWYIHFLFTYLTWKQLLAMAMVFNILYHLLNISLANLLLFWILPSMLSTLQLFFFGTYLPHRESMEAFTDHHRARSNDYNILVSLVTCYHFGYHWEHHQYPYVPWWKLPKVRQQIIQSPLS